MATWGKKDISKANDMSRNGRTPEKANEKGDLCGRGSWWLGTLKVRTELSMRNRTRILNDSSQLLLSIPLFLNPSMSEERRDTPIPGRYHIRDFIEEAELNPVRKTYGFKGLGRRAPIQHVRQGDLLLPGAYGYTDSTQEVLMRQASCSFKSCPRPDIYTLGIRDKDIHTSPCDYNVTEKPVDKIPCKHVMFRSAVQRISFLPKEGPAPCQYNLQTGPAKGITSCFKSTVPRLHSVCSKTPGPGTYEPSWQMGHHPGMEVTTGQAHGLFFRVF